MAGLPARDRRRRLADRRDGQGRRALLLLPAAEADAGQPAGLAAAGRASTSATPTWCPSTTSPRRWTTSRTCPTATARPSTWSTPSRSRWSRWSTRSAPRPAHRGSRRRSTAGRPAPMPFALVPRALRPSTILTSLVKAGPGAGAARPDRRPARHPRGGPGAHPFTPVFDSRRTEKALAGSGIAVPDLESYARTLWGYWEENLDTSTARDADIRAALKGKHVVITGASSGIGQVTALKVAQAGGIPVLVARGKDKLEETRADDRAARRHGPRLPAATCPTSRRSTGCASSWPPSCPSIDFVVNNAGRSIRRSLRLSHDRFHDFERTMQLNYFGAIRLVMGLLPTMREQKRGHIVNISLDRRADQPAAVLGVRRLQGRPRLVEQRRGLRARRRRDHVHQHPHAAGADADDRADQDLRQVPDDLARRRRPTW